MTTNVLAVGNSHIASLRSTWIELGPRPGINFDFVSLASDHFNIVEDPQARAAVRTFVNQENPPYDLIVLSISGNEHQRMGLVNHPRPFDFVLEEDPCLPLKEGREIVPQALIEAALRSWIRANLFEDFRAWTTRSLYQLESPPPIMDHEHIMEYPGKFGDLIGQFGVNDPIVRYKCWRLQCSIVRRICETLSIGYIEAPKEGLNPRGFLDPRAYSPDPTHANAWYGNFVCEQIRSLAREMHGE